MGDGGQEGGAVAQTALHSFIHQVKPRPGRGAVSVALDPNGRILQVLRRGGGAGGETLKQEFTFHDVQHVQTEQNRLTL